MAKYSTFGRHVTMDLRDVSYQKLNDAAFLEQTLKAAARSCGATVVGECFVQFTPQGVTGVLVLSESHLSIHTYPEEGFAAIDCYTCGHSVDPRAACNHLHHSLGGRVAGYRALQRGTGDIIDLPAVHLATAPS